MDSIWTEASDGLSRCSRHPDAAPFAAHVGCSSCHVDADAPATDDATPTEGEQLCEDAERRGLPDALEVEARMWAVWTLATKRAETCAALADQLSRIPLGDSPPSGYPFDLDLAAKFEASAAKWMDVGVKAGKLATAPILHRERQARHDRRQRLLDKNKATH